MGWTTIERLKWTRAGLAFALAAALAVDPILAEAQEAPAAVPAIPNAEQSQAASFTPEELLKLLAPIALYPDPLLAQMLPASAYPLQIVQAQRWLDKNCALVAKNDFSGIDSQKWDPAVKAIARFPEVMLKMNTDLAWTTDLGDAFVNQPQDVADAIQRLRAEAEAAGALTTTPQQTVNTVVSSTSQGEKTIIAIEPTDPSTIYVPTYAPAAVYAPSATSVVAPLLTFGAGVALAAAATGAYWNWNTGAVRPPTWAGYPGYRPGYGGSRPINAGNINTGNVNIGNDVKIGSGNGNQAWKPNGSYRPGQGSKPGIGARPGGPGGIGGAGNRPGNPGGAGGIGARPGGPGGIGGVGNRPGGAGGIGGAGNRPDGIGGAGNRPGKPGDIGGTGNRPGNPGGVGNRPGGAGGGLGGAGSGGRPGGVSKPGASRPATRPAGRPGQGGQASRPSRSPGGFQGGNRGGSQGAQRGGMHGGGHRAGAHGGAHRGGGRHGGGGGGRRRSDIRLKHDIMLIGRLDDGLGFYRFVYNGGHTTYVGVIAQEVELVRPEAVSRGADGYLRVSYNVLGVPFETYQRWLADGAHLPSVTPAAP